MGCRSSHQCIQASVCFWTCVCSSGGKENSRPEMLPAAVRSIIPHLEANQKTNSSQVTWLLCRRDAIQSYPSLLKHSIHTCQRAALSPNVEVASLLNSTGFDGVRLLENVTHRSHVHLNSALNNLRQIWTGCTLTFSNCFKVWCSQSGRGANRGMDHGWRLVKADRQHRNKGNQGGHMTEGSGSVFLYPDLKWAP